MDVFSVMTSRAMDVLKTLSKEPKTRKELSRELGLSPSSLSQIIRKLENFGCIGEVEGVWTLELKGKLVLKMYEAVSRYESLFDSVDLNEYYVEDIPEHLIDRFFELSGVRVVNAFDRTIFKPHMLVIRDILESEKVSGYSAMLYPEYAEVFIKIAEKGVEVEAIVSEAVFTKVKQEFSEDLQKFLSFDNVTLLVADNYAFSSILTTKSFFMSFFFKNRTLDYTRFYAWNDRDGLRWGNELFEYIRENSYEVRLDDSKDVEIAEI